MVKQKRLISRLLSMFLVFLLLCAIIPAGASAQENGKEEKQMWEVPEETAPVSEKLDTPLEGEQSNVQEVGEPSLKQENTIFPTDMQTDENGEAELTLPVEKPEKSALTSIADEDYEYDTENHKLTVYTNEGTNKWRSEVPDIKGAVITLEIMKGVTAIEDEAFFGCTSLNEVLIADTVENIGPKGFAYCTSLKQISIPSSVKEIGKLAFSVCNSLAEIYLSEGLEYIGERAFLGCPMENIVLPEGIKIIKDRAFVDCKNLKSITIPEGVNFIDGGIFAGCLSLETVNLPETATQIAGGAFYKCISLKTINIPENIMSLGMGTFAGCASLETINIPLKVTVLDESVFQDCASLESIEIPKDVVKIAESAFEGCTRLLSITMKPMTPPDIDEYIFENLPENYKIFVPAGTVEIYKTSQGWSEYKDHILEVSNNYYYDDQSKKLTIMANAGTTEWRKDYPEEIAFVQTVDIQEGVTAIEKEAFKDCRSLAAVSISDSVENIGESAFSGCKSLAEIAVPKNIERIPKTAFAECEELEKVILSEGLASIGEYAFFGCEGLKSITIPESVSAIFDNAFVNCENLAVVNISRKIPANIGISIFSGLPENYRIYVPAGTVFTYRADKGWSEYKDHICEKVQFKDLKANGESEKETTTELTLVFDQDIKGLTLDDITLKGAAKVKLIQDKESGVYKLKIKDISVKNNEEVNVKVQKDGYCINPNDKDVGVYVKKTSSDDPKPSDDSKSDSGKKSGKNVKTGIVDTKAGAYCAVFILSIAGIAALGFKRKINL